MDGGWDGDDTLTGYALSWPDAAADLACGVRISAGGFRWLRAV